MDIKSGELRVGTGYDVHRLVEGRDLILGGVKIPWEKGLDGHSDADVLTHAIMDALLGAAGFPDIGGLFPDDYAEYEGISSLLLLERVMDLLTMKDWKVVNIDSTVICQAPKLRDHINDMEVRLSEIIGVDAERVNVKATTTERLGFEGRGEGIAAEAVCLIQKI